MYVCMYVGMYVGMYIVAYFELQYGMYVCMYVGMYIVAYGRLHSDTHASNLSKSAQCTRMHSYVTQCLHTQESA